jgi:beta-mannosidase
MTLGEWSGAVVEPTTGGSPPTPDEWRSVDLPGSPDAFAGADCAAYRTTFPDPREGDQTRALVTLRGLFARSRVWLNGEFVGDHDAYFEPAGFAFDPEPSNELVVECRSPDGRFGGVHDTPLVPDEDAVPAVWWDATVEGLPPIALLDVAVTPHLTGDGGRIETQLTVDAARSGEASATVSLRPVGFRGGGWMERESISVRGGERKTVTRTVHVDDPELWYPRGVGSQNRYAVAVRLSGRELSAETGFRTLSYGDDGFEVNGVPVPARGFDVLPSPDPFGDVERAVEANANFLRAHAHVPPAAFHRACGEAGLLVWQDLPLTGPGGYDIDRGKELARRLDRAVKHHPAVVAYGVHDDPRNVFGSGVGGGRTGRARVRWRAWRAGYNRGPDEAVADAFPGDRPTFPVSGPLGIGADAAHLYPGWDFGTAGDVDWLTGRYPEACDVVTEFGAGALADDGDVGDAAGFDRAKHDARVDGGVAASQAHQASVLKTVAEGLRRHGSQVVAAFALRDTDDAGMGVLGADGGAKAGFDAIASAYEPLVAVLDGPPRGSVGTTVVNDTPDAVSGSVAWAAGDDGGETEFEVGAFDRAAGPPVSVPRDAETVVLELSAGARVVENRYER